MMTLDSLGVFSKKVRAKCVCKYLLEPILSIDEGDGPMKTMPSSANRLAKFAFSLRKPYLWMEFINKADENELKTGVILPWMYCLRGSLDIL